MKNFQKLGILLILCLFLLPSCKKDIPALLYQSGGYIQGSIIGISKDGTGLNESLGYDKFESLSDANYVIYDTYNTFDIKRSDPNNDCFIRITFQRSVLGNITNKFFTIRYVKELANNKLLIYAPFGSEIKTFDLLDVIFDSNTGYLKGRFAVSIEMNSGGTPSVKRLSTISGDFDLTVYQLVK